MSRITQAILCLALASATVCVADDQTKPAAQTNVKQDQSKPLGETIEDLNDRSSVDPGTYKVLVKIEALNQRLAADEASLPAEIDRHVVKQLLDRIDALDARIKELEEQRSKRQ
jgi:hypothetical protein